MMQVGLISNAEATSLLKSGSVGDICVHWIDAAGTVIDHPLNRRVIALPPSRPTRSPCKMGVNWGNRRTCCDPD
jgi:DNA-binding transcriptional regulator LsrR (DeoR family)